MITIKRDDNFNTDSDTCFNDLDIELADLDTNKRESDTNLDNKSIDLDTKLADLDTKRRKLSNKEKDIVLFCSVPRSTKEILNRVGVSMHSKNREKYVTSLVEVGYLEIIPTCGDLEELKE